MCTEPVNETVWLMTTTIVVVVGLLALCVVVVAVIVVVVVVVHRKPHTPPGNQLAIVSTLFCLEGSENNTENY